MKKNSENPDQMQNLEVGLRLTLEHIDQLLADSELLLKKKRYSASIPLSIIAIEEIGKSNFVESLIQMNKPLTEELWKKITSGGVAHVTKTTSLIVAEKLFIDKVTPEKDEELEQMMKKIGVPYADNKLAKINNMLRKATYLRLENLKHDCLYTNKEGEKWVTFTKRFTEYEQSAIAYYLFSIASRTHASRKFSLLIPQKQFKEYSKQDIKKSQKLWNKQFKPIMKKTEGKKISHLIDQGLLFLHNNYSPDKRGLVKEKESGWLDLDY